MGASAFFTRTDVSKAEHVSNLTVTTLSKYGTIDVLVDDAGIYPFLDFLDTPLGTGSSHFL
jgi:NADP-dependent 3-hydroxy acid dehydrogenase YdfG